MENYGLVLYYEDKHYMIPLHDGTLVKYPIGGLICEYLRLTPDLLKALFQKYPYNSDPISERPLNAAISWLNDRISNGLLPAQSGIVMGEVMNNHQIFQMSMDYQREMLPMHLNSLSTIPPQMKAFFLEGTGKTEFCIDTIGDYLTCLMGLVVVNYVTAYQTIAAIVEKSPSAVEKIHNLTNERLAEQDFSYKIIYLDGKFTPTYTVKNGFSLMLLEAVNMMENGVEISICKNCGNYFIPRGRRDARYCNYLSPQDDTRTCKEIGAQAARKKKEHNDPVTKEYRKKYLRLTMAVRRNPGDKEKEKALQHFVEESDKWKKRIADGISTEEEFIEWICTADEREQ